MKIHVALTWLTTVSLGGCVTVSTPVEKGYSGPTAMLKDSYEVPAGSNCGSFFVLREYEGKIVDNALVETATANQGMGPMLGIPKSYSRPIPAREAAFHISAQTDCAAPIQELMGTTYIVHGIVHFTPAPDNVYVVTGELGPERGAVWVRNESTGTQVGNRLLIEGAPKASKWDGSMTGHLTELPPSP